jgi:hypothetical protein
MPGPASTSLYDDVPTTGKALYKWAEARGLVKWFQRLGRSWSLPGKLIDWQPADVAAAVAECQRKAEGPANGRPAAAVRNGPTTR